MKTIEEVKDYLLKNRVDEGGNLDLCELDFSDFDGNVYINEMKVKKCLYQSFQKVQGDLFQSYQKVQGEFITQKLQKDEKYKIDECGDNCIVKKVKKEKGN